MSDGDQGFVDEHAIAQQDESVVHPKYSDILRKEAPKTGIYRVFLYNTKEIIVWFGKLSLVALFFFVV